MMKMRVMSVCLCLVFGSWLHAQERRAAGPPYNPEEEVTVAGVVVGVENFTLPDGVVHVALNITVEGKPLAVMLGPQQWFGTQRFTFEKDAAVQVTGLTGRRLNSRPAMLPRVVKVGTRTLTIRNPKGIPMWEGGLSD